MAVHVKIQKPPKPRERDSNATAMRRGGRVRTARVNFGKKGFFEGVVADKIGESKGNEKSNEIKQVNPFCEALGRIITRRGSKVSKRQSLQLWTL